MSKDVKSRDEAGSSDPQVSAVSGTLTRRRFLQALAAVGATVALPVSIAVASSEAIDAAWEQALREPWYFVVGEFGTIVDPSIAEPKIRADVFDIWEGSLTHPESLIRAVEPVAPLVSALQAYADDHLSELEYEVEQMSPRTPGRAAKVRLIKAMSHPDDGWKGWVRHEGAEGIGQFRKFVERWLSEPIDWGESEWFGRDWGGQGQAYRFFQGMDSETCDALGIVIVAGDCPGSSYFAAELHHEIADANAAAERLGLPFRFRPEEVRS